LAEPLEEDVEMVAVIEDKPEPFDFVRMIVSGQFTYLTYFILSTTCFFFWLSPNCHKLRHFFGHSQASQATFTRRSQVKRTSSVPQRQVQTRSSLSRSKPSQQ
jgi:hypothetical protein